MSDLDDALNAKLPVMVNGVRVGTFDPLKHSVSVCDGKVVITLEPIEAFKEKEVSEDKWCVKCKATVSTIQGVRKDIMHCGRCGYSIKAPDKVGPQPRMYCMECEKIVRVEVHPFTNGEKHNCSQCDSEDLTELPAKAKVEVANMWCMDCGKMVGGEVMAHMLDINWCAECHGDDLVEAGPCMIENYHCVTHNHERLKYQMEITNTAIAGGNAGISNQSVPIPYDGIEMRLYYDKDGMFEKSYDHGNRSYWSEDDGWWFK